MPTCSGWYSRNKEFQHVCKTLHSFESHQWRQNDAGILLPILSITEVDVQQSHHTPTMSVNWTHNMATFWVKSTEVLPSHNNHFWSKYKTNVQFWVFLFKCPPTFLSYSTLGLFWPTFLSLLHVRLVPQNKLLGIVAATRLFTDLMIFLKRHHIKTRFIKFNHPSVLWCHWLGDRECSFLLQKLLCEREPANPGLPGKWPLNGVCVCVCFKKFDIRSLQTFFGGLCRLYSSPHNLASICRRTSSK